MSLRHAPAPQVPSEEDLEYARTRERGIAYAQACVQGARAPGEIVTEFVKLQLRHGHFDSLPHEFLGAAVKKLTALARSRR